MSLHQANYNENENKILIQNYITTITSQKNLLSNDNYDNEIANSEGTTSELIDITNKYAALWKNEMQLEHDQIIDLLDDKDKDIFINSQNSWETFIDYHNQLILNSNIQLYGGGIIY